MHSVGTILLHFTLQTAIEGLVGSCYEWHMGKLKLGNWAVILGEEVEKWGLDLSGKMDRRRDVETFCNILQMQMNLMKMGEERSLVSHWKMKNLREEEYPVDLWFILGITKLRGNGKVTLSY